MFDLKNTALFAIFASIGALWTQIRGFIDYFISIFVVKITLRYGLLEAFTIYSSYELKRLNMGDYSFRLDSPYLKPKQRRAEVAFRTLGTKSLFFKNKTPILVSSKETDSSSDSATISFFRYTMNIEKFIFEVTEYYDNYKRTNCNTASRFNIRKFHGKNKSSNSERDQMDKVYGSPGEGTFNRPVGYDIRDIGELSGSKEDFFGLFYNKEVLDLKDTLVHWHKSEDWYKQRGIKWRIGCGLYGLPGAGKSSFVRAIAKKLDMPIHVYDLTSMDNRELTEFWQQSVQAAPCVVLIEDIDRIFDQHKKVQGARDKSPLTMDCLLNLINGVEPADGLAVFVTANDMSKIDPALGVLDKDGKSTRPGRLDRVLIMGPLDRECRVGIANKILKDIEVDIDSIVDLSEGETAAQFEERCKEIALKEYWKSNVK